MAIQKSNVIHAAASVPGAAGYVDGTFTVNAGFSNCARTGAGAYNLTVTEAIDANDCVCIVTVRGATTLETALAHTSDTVKAVALTSNAGAATDAPFDVVIFRVNN